jgi:hypothetical protein
VVRGEVEKEDEGFEGGAHNGRRLTVVRVVARVEKEDVAEWSRALSMVRPGPFVSLWRPVTTRLTGSEARLLLLSLSAPAPRARMPNAAGTSAGQQEALPPSNLLNGKRLSSHSVEKTHG